ncbi:hypothetical protein LI328DRAFT_8286 [Trichoderma asperelloides]|nr:hypothetical protein LI328DRAFT_8286 [Trichoderma asperelloides]
MFLDRPSERSKASPGLILRSAPSAELAIPRFFAGAAAAVLFLMFGNIKEAVKLNTRDKELKESNEADERRARFLNSLSGNGRDDKQNELHQADPFCHPPWPQLGSGTHVLRGYA